MKKIITFFVLAAMLFTHVYAGGEIKVLINDVPVEFDVPPRIINDRTMVPVRKIFENLGATVDWHDEAQLIIAKRNELIIAMEIGKADFSVTNVITGEIKNIELDVSPVIFEERTLVPVRAISEGLGYIVDWIGDTQTVLISEYDM